jgi:adenosylcobinamide kinase/adenosylcobinamide-phosphate guanylyltransferase
MAVTEGLTQAPHFTLVLGGARSGKSRYAEALLERLPPPWIYVATAEPGDAEMVERIAMHRARRDRRWQTHEVSLDLAAALARMPHGASVLVDCLTLWLSNHMLKDAEIELELARLDAAVGAAPLRLIAVANEVGCGIVPDNPLARRFRDAAGRLNQRLAARADRVLLLVAGIPMRVK